MLSVILLSLFLVGCNSVNRNECSTYNSHPGLCIPLKECPSLYALAQSSAINPTSAVLDILINSDCSDRDHPDMVCCSLSEIGNKYSPSGRPISCVGNEASMA